jgi:Uma2 family endonuclease
MAAPTLGEPVAKPVAILREEPLYEIVNGKRVELLPMGLYESTIANILGFHLNLVAIPHQLGWIEIEVLFLLPVANQQRRPDVAFVSYQRWPRNRPLPRGDAWPVAPDLAVEVVSPSNQADEVMRKMNEYFQAGAQRVWIVWPSLKQVYVYESPTQVRILTGGDELDGQPMLPGFRLPVAGLFEVAVEEPANGNAGP